MRPFGQDAAIPLLAVVAAASERLRVGTFVLKFADLRERFGISSFLIDDLDALAPVAEELAGR
jgi:hypothetical protein